MGEGEIQELNTQAAMFASQVRTVCEEMGWAEMATITTRYQERAECGGPPDLAPLMKIQNVRAPRARALFKAGYTTAEKVAQGKETDLARALAAAPGATTEARVHEHAAKALIRSAK